jgi:ATP-dependent Clp protease ATP-binding subunit ClpC
VEEARQDEKTILFLDELHTILSQRSDASQMLKTDLARGTIKVIGATTFSEYRQIEEDSALARRFQKVIVKEPSPGETLEILRRIKGDYEKHHNVQIPDEVLQEIIRLSVRYIKDRFLPDKAIDLMDEAAAKLKLMTLKEVGRETERGLDEQIKEAILSGDYTEAKRLCSLREK